MDSYFVVLSRGTFWCYVLYLIEPMSHRNKTRVYVRVVCGYGGSKITVSDGAYSKCTFYRDGVEVDTSYEKYYEIASGYDYSEIEEIAALDSEEVVEEVVEEEVGEEVEEVTKEDYFEEAVQKMRDNGYYFTGGTTIHDTSRDIENDIYDGSRVLIKVEIDTDAYDVVGRQATGSFYHYTQKMSWTKDPSSIYPASYSVQMGKTLNLTISRSNSSYKHDLYYSFGNRTMVKFASDVTGSTYAWSVPDIASLCSDATSGNLMITCRTYHGIDYRGASDTNVTLSVPDPTTPVIASSITLGTAYAITCTRNSSNFEIRLEFVFKNETTLIYQGKVNSASWTPSYDLAKLIPALVSAGGTLQCTTLNGTAVVGTKSVSVTVVVPENDTTRPAFSSGDLTLAPVSSLDSTFAGLYIRGKTGLKATMEASSTYSTIAGYSITAGNISASGNPSIIDLLSDEGTVTVTAKVTDARGFTRTVTTSIYIYPYRRPKVVPVSGYDDVICERANASGSLSPSGTHLAIKAGKSYSEISPYGTNLNPCILRFRWKVSGADEFGYWSTLLGYGSSVLNQSVMVSGVVSSLSTSYVVEIQALDSLGGSHTMTFTIMTEAISFCLYDGVDGAAFGKYPEEPHVVDIASHMTLRVRGKFVVDGEMWQSLDLASGVEESVYSYGRYGDTGCYYHVDNGNHVYVAFNCAFSYAGTAVVINSTAIPEGARPPRTVGGICPVNDHGIAMVTVSSDGYIRVAWVQKLTDTVLTGSATVVFIDGYLDYWT